MQIDRLNLLGLKKQLEILATLVDQEIARQTEAPPAESNVTVHDFRSPPVSAPSVVPPNAPSLKIWEQITPANWNKYSFARTRYGLETNISSPTACRWCLGGWVIKVYGDDKGQELFHQISRALDMSAAQFNDLDKTMFEDVYTLVKRLDI